MEQQSQAHENYLRAVSEATDRMHEMRLESAKQVPAQTTSINLEGVKDLVNSVQGVSEVAKQTSEHIKSVAEQVKEMKVESAKPRKRTVKNNKTGVTYSVDG